MKTKLLLLALLCGFQISIAQISFSTNSNLVNTSHTDRCVVDMNGDTRDDIVSVSTTNIQVFYQQVDGSYLERNYPTSPANNSPSWSLAAADYNRDGFADLVYGGGNGVTFMRSVDNGSGIDGVTYEEISFPQFVFSQRSNFVDINNDGNLDAFVCHDVEPNVFYINDGNGNLTYNQGSLGDYPTGGNYGSVWVDFDNDRDVDMFISKCGGESARRDNEMHRNNGDGTFDEVGSSIGLEDDMQTWSSAWADFDNDGDMDAWVGASNTGDGFHRLMRNNGNNSFTDVIAGSGLEGLTTTSIENQTYDFDNDGNSDIVIGGRILYGNGDLTFTIGNFIDREIFGDLNNDGFIDGFGFGSARLNNGNSNNWIKITTVGVASNVHGIGARVEITTESGTQIRDVRSGEGFGNMSTMNVHFGLGLDEDIQDVTIYWPSGVIDMIEDLNVNETYTIVEGEGVLGLSEFVVEDLITYPNPTKNVLNIKTISTIEDPLFTVFDLTGKRVMHGRLDSTVIDVSALHTGTYFLRVFDKKYDKNTTQVQKFIKL